MSGEERDCDVKDRCCWDGGPDGPACWNVSACGCKVIDHSPAIHPADQGGQS